MEMKYRQRYVDLIMNEETRKVFLGRSKLYAYIHKFLGENGFLEVETPILQNAVCGASAKPFYTHHNALDMDCNLRIAPETYLKHVLLVDLIEYMKWQNVLEMRVWIQNTFRNLRKLNGMLLIGTLKIILSFIKVLLEVYLLNLLVVLRLKLRQCY